MARNPQLSQKASEKLGLPDGFKAYSPFPFAGMNQQASPLAMPDNEFLWVENFVRLGDGNLRTLWDNGSSIYSPPAGTTIVYYGFFTLASAYYCAVFLSDGSAVQVSMNSLAVTQIGPPGGFYNAASGFLPYVKQWGTTYLLICNRNTQNDYWIWDGTLLYGAGSAAPNGVQLTAGGFNYSSPPAVTAFGGNGSGMKFTVNVNASSVSEILIDNPGSGYLPGDVVQLAFSGGGSDTSAILEAVLTPVPVGGVAVSSGGLNYASPPAVTFTGGGGTGAAGTAQISQGVVGVSVPAPGSGYTSPPAVVFSGGGGSGAAAIALITNGSVTSVVVTVAGTGYTSGPAVSFSGGGGSGAVADSTIGGTVSGVTLTSGGTGYTSTPAVAFSGGGGTGAIGEALLSPTSVASVNIVNGGTGYTGTPSVPLITFSGGGGSGAVGTTSVSGGAVSAVSVSNGGQYYTSPPAVIISGGANNAAGATVSLMPFGVSGSAMETFLSRVWIVNPAPSPFSTVPPGNNYSYSAPGSLTNFATSAGGGNSTNTDAFLQTQYVNVRQSSGYLYFFGDGSISVVSNVSTSGTPVTTTFNYQNIDPQAGLEWRDSLQDFGRSTIAANRTGVYGLYGGAATKVSPKMDAVFDAAIFPQMGGVTPSAAIATIHNVKHYAVLMSVLDPDTEAQRTIMALWNEKEWTVASQSVNLTFIASRKAGSVYSAWGTDGNGIYPLFSNPSSTLPKRIDTKIYGTDRPFIEKQGMAVWVQAQDKSAAQLGINANLALVGSGITPQSGVIPSLPSGIGSPFYKAKAQMSSPYPFWNVWATGIQGVGFMSAGLRITSTSSDFTLGNLVLGYADVVAYF